MTPRATARALGHASLPSRAALAAASARAAALVAAVTALAACAAAPRQDPAPAPIPAPVSTTTAAAPVVIDSAARAISARLLADSPAVTRPAMPLPRYALDVDVSAFESHDKVARYVALFAGEGRERFAARLERGTRFDAMIRARLREAGLPEDLTYLALVESGYDPNAVSRASAVGMWQFMAETARPLGLRVDWWVDERRDPVKATDAAVKNLRWLRKEFGSLFLAAAAYNGGPGRVGRGLAQLAALSDSTEGEARFFALADGGLLRTETVNYVPQIIAAAIVAGEPERYGITVRPMPPFTYDSVFVRELTPLAAVATAARATRDELLDLNPQLLRGMTPPGTTTLVRLPPGAADGFASRLAEVPAAERRAFRGVVTKAGQTVRSIATRERVPASEIRRFNPRLATVKKGKRKGTLVAGQTVRIPTAAVLSFARAIGDVDGDGPSGLPTAVPAAAPARSAAVDGGDDTEPSTPSRGDKGKAAKRADKATKGAAKAAGNGAGKGAAKASSKVASKRTAKAAARDAAPTSAKKGAASASAKAAAKSSAKGAAKGSVKGAAKATAKSAAKPAAKASTKAAAGAKAKPTVTKKAAGKPAATSSRAKSAKDAKASKG